MSGEGKKDFAYTEIRKIVGSETWVYLSKHQGLIQRIFVIIANISILLIKCICPYKHLGHILCQCFLISGRGSKSVKPDLTFCWNHFMDSSLVILCWIPTTPRLCFFLDTPNPAKNCKMYIISHFPSSFRG